MTQWWERSPPTNVAWVRFLHPRLMWVEFVVSSLLCCERFSSWYSGFPFPQKPTFPNFHSILECRGISNELLWTSGATWQTNYIYIYNYIWKETSSQSKFWLQTWSVRSVALNSSYIQINREINLAFFSLERSSLLGVACLRLVLLWVLARSLLCFFSSTRESHSMP